MVCGNTSDFIDHPLPKNYVGPPTTPGPQAPPPSKSGAVVVREVCSGGPQNISKCCSILV